MLFSNMKKGITPIVSVVLLLLLTIALAGGVMVWLTGYTGGLQDDILVKGTPSCREEAGTNNLIVRAAVFNVGQGPLDAANNLNLYYVNGPTDLGTTATTPISGTASIPAGQQALVTFNVTTSSDPASGTYSWDLLSNAGTVRFASNCA